MANCWDISGFKNGKCVDIVYSIKEDKKVGYL